MREQEGMRNFFSAYDEYATYDKLRSQLRIPHLDLRERLREDYEDPEQDFIWPRWTTGAGSIAMLGSTQARREEFFGG